MNFHFFLNQSSNPLSVSDSVSGSVSVKSGIVSLSVSVSLSESVRSGMVVGGLFCVRFVCACLGVIITIVV